MNVFQKSLSLLSKRERRQFWVMASPKVLGAFLGLTALLGVVPFLYSIVNQTILVGSRRNEGSLGLATGAAWGPDASPHGDVSARLRSRVEEENSSVPHCWSES